MTCPLCLGDCAKIFFIKKKSSKTYWDCPDCSLIYLDPKDLLNQEKEKAHYGTHNNDIHDPRYQEFVADVVDTVKELFPSTTKGLDYGAGPGPVISYLLENDGYSMQVYDPFFSPNDQALAQTYDFIVSCEVIEHFVNPRKEFLKLSKLLRPGGALIVKSHFYDESIHFPSWYYHGDPTHIAFYRKETFSWIKKNLDFQDCQTLSSRLAVLKK